MASLSTTKAIAAVALVAVLSVLVTTAVRAEDYNTSAAIAYNYNTAWVPAKATWYGAPTGAGPDDNGGACGFKHTNQYPFSSMTSCGNEPIFKDGKGCGACYQIRCTKQNHPACSGNPQTVIITDMNYYPVAKYHFDLSGTAFGSMALPGLNDKLRHAGIIDMQFRRVLCNFPGLTINFHVTHDSNPNYLAVLVEYANKEGTVVQVDIKDTTKSGAQWQSMRQSWGDIWRMDSAKPLIGPFSMRIRSDAGRTLIANNIIPRNWKPNADYRSSIQYN